MRTYQVRTYGCQMNVAFGPASRSRLSGVPQRGDSLMLER